MLYYMPVEKMFMITSVSNRIEPQRVLTLIPAAGIVASNMIGTGIFTTTGLMIAMGASHGDILLAWAIGGIISLCGAFCYAEIGANFPNSGGEYRYLSTLLHPSLGFIAGCVSLTVGFAAPIAASSMAMHLYLGTVIPNWPVRFMVVVTIIVISLLHAYDLRLGSRVQTFLIGIKLLLLFAFIGATLFKSKLWMPHSDFNLKTSLGLSPSFAIVLIFVSFAYSGWNAAVYIGAEIKNPVKNIPLALLIGTGSVMALYLLINLAFISALPLERLSGIEETAHIVGKHLWGNTGGQLVSIIIALTLILPISAMIMVGPRVISEMSRDGLLPTFLSKLNSRNVPAYAVLLQGVIASIFALTSSFGPLLIFIGFTLNIFTALTVMCLFRLRWKGEIRHHVCIGYPVTPLIYAGFALWVTVWSLRTQPKAALIASIALLAIYLIYQLKMRLKKSPLLSQKN